MARADLSQRVGVQLGDSGPGVTLPQSYGKHRAEGYHALDQG